MQASQPSGLGRCNFMVLLCASHRAPEDCWPATATCGILGSTGGATASSCDMGPQAPEGRYPEAREGSAGPDPIEGAITRPAGLSDGAIINPSVESGTEETVALAGTLLIIDTFVVGWATAAVDSAQGYCGHGCASWCLSVAHCTHHLISACFWTSLGCVCIRLMPRGPTEVGCPKTQDWTWTLITVGRWAEPGIWSSSGTPM